MVNLGSFIRFHATRTPDRLAVVYRDQRITYRDLLDRVEQLSAWLAEQGVGPEAVVACFMKNSAAFLGLVFAASHIGAIFLPINYRLSRDEVGYIVGNAGARILIADLELAAIGSGSVPVVLLDETAQSSITHLAPDAAPAPLVYRGPRDLMRLIGDCGDEYR